MSPPTIEVRKRKYNDTLWGYYTDFLLYASPQLTVLWQPRGTIIHRPKNTWAISRDHLQYFFPGKGYCISADYERDGQLRHCYCDIIAPIEPLEPKARNLIFTDLELDLHVEPTGYYAVLDEDEFDAAVTNMSYSYEVKQGALDALAELTSVAALWQDPFNRIPLLLPRFDLHNLDTRSAEWRQALATMHLYEPRRH